MIRSVLIAVFAFFSCLVNAQSKKQLDAAQIKLELKKLNTLGAVLYVAAHPDDENTRAIASLASERLVNTAYLSMTRGDGGQNLIGPEIRDLLGLIRTQELLAARRIDGGQQFFTRANDFGFSKNSKETFEIWNKNEILSDVVRVIRQFKPDVILTRFPPDERAGHGHHTASAMLAQEAFDITNDPTAFPDQVAQYGTWQVKRLFTNTGRWWNQTINENTPGVVTMNVGTYNTLIGKSYSEIAAESRTQHKSQGFGSPGRRGDAPEYFEFVKGESAQKDILEGVNITWSRVKGGDKVQPLVEKAIREFNVDNPSALVPQLLQIRKQIELLDASIWKTRKMADVNSLIQGCLGLFAEVTTDNYWVTPTERVTASFELLNRSAVEVQLSGIKSSDLSMDTVVAATLKNNIPFTFKSKKAIRSGKDYSDPYWLRLPHSQGLFNVPDQVNIGKPENEPSLFVTFNFLINGEPLVVNSPLIYKWTDPVKGELSRPFEIVPPVFVNLRDKVLVFKDQASKEVSLLIKSASERALSGTLKLVLPAGWKSEPASIPVELGKRGQELNLTFKVMPGKEEITTSLGAVVEIEGKQYDQSLLTINYDHIPVQTLLPKAEAKVVRLDLKKEGGVIGYIKGAGDDVPAALRNMGYEVWEMKNEEVTAANLARLDAVVLGIRALNTNERIRHFMGDLMNYVKNGGTMITQYNTNFDMELDLDKIAPYSLTLSRDRVTEENSAVRILKPDHAALNYPNKITAKDFEGWVQERGLYFPDKWDPNFESLLSMNDNGETPRDGSLLIAKYGAGHYVYTGLSFFRELPEGVPGAYRLFANLTSLGKGKKPDVSRVKTKAK